MITQNDIHTNNAFKYIWKFYRIIGADPPEKFNIFYFIYFILINLIISIYYPLSMVINLCFIRDFLTLLDNLSQNIMDAVCSFKLLNFMIQRNKLRSINTLFDALDERVKCDYARKLLNKRIKIAHNVYWYFWILYNLTIFFSGLSTFLSNYKTFKKIMYSAWFPFDWTATKTNWYVAFFYQFIGLGLQGIQNACNDSYPVEYFIMLTTHFQLLKERIQKIGSNPQMTSNENYKELIKCIEDYNTLLEIHRIVAQVISVAMFIQYFMSGSVLTIGGLYILISERNIYRDAYFVFYAICIVSEIIIACYFANNLETESEGLTTAIYNCNWIDQDRKFRKTLLSFMQRTQIHIRIRAANWLNVNLKGFLSMMRIAYSILAVLIQVKSK